MSTDAHGSAEEPQPARTAEEVDLALDMAGELSLVRELDEYLVTFDDRVAQATSPERLHHSVSVAAVVTDDKGRVLVIKRMDNGAWQLPGGVLELDERIEDGIVREVLEETNVVVRPVQLTGIYKNMALGVVALVMRTEIVNGEPKPMAESSEVDWWTRDRVSAEMTEAFAIRILDALDHVDSAAIRYHDGVKLL